MTVTKTQYANVKEVMEEVHRLPVEAQRTIFNMMHGAIAISDMYTMTPQIQPPDTRPSA